MSLNYFVGRQPIFNSDSSVLGYELLYRANTESQDVFNADQATSIVILNLLERGLSEVVGKYPAYINVPKQFIFDDILPTRGINQIVLELQKDIIEADNSVIEAIRNLKSLGYLVALDNFTFHTSLEPLYKLADIVKLDIQSQTNDKLAQEIAILKKYPVRIVALKVETPEEFNNCKLLKFDCRIQFVSATQLCGLEGKLR